MDIVNRQFKLFTHNQQAYEAAMHLMDEKGKAAVIHPTGTGKSFIAFKLAAEHPNQRILWLAPSEYIFRTQIENLKKVIDVSAKEADSAVKVLLENVIFITYSRLMMNEDDIDSFRPDYIVLDEFHRCGAVEWGSSVRKLIQAYPESKLLGLSATNIRYLDNQRDMAQELFDGCVASEMSLGEAIARKILPAPSYVISMYSYQEELRRLTKRVENERNQRIKKQNEKLIEELRRTLENAEGLDRVFSKHMKAGGGKYLVFCANKDHMEEMLSHVGEWFHLVDQSPHIYAVYYDNPETSKAFAEFKADNSEHLRLLFCIDMLNEGVHVDKIDGVILLRPTVSPILYLQQIGRSLSAGGNGKAKPVIFDIVNNFNSLYAIDALQNEFETSLSSIPCTKEERNKYYDGFQIIDELRNCREIFRRLNANLSASWDTYYLAAREYYEQKGDLKVPSAYVTDSGLKLGSWIQTQRRVHEGKVRGCLSNEQIAKLEAVGMIWDDMPVQNFNQGCEELERYRKQNGNADVQARYVSDNGFLLGKWVTNIRTAYKNGKLDHERQEQLNKLDMIWDVREYRWNLNYEAAKAYYESHGNLQIPFNYVTRDGISLGRWISNQIKIHNQLKSGSTPLTDEQTAKLEAIGIVWKNKFEDGWDKKYEMAKAYYEEHGNLNMSSTYMIDGTDIGKWVSTIRLKMKNPKSSNLVLSERRIKQMDAIGITWDSTSS